MLLQDLCVKFNILKPFEVRVLCEILEMIGSIRLLTVNEPEIDIFSDFVGGTTTEPATFFCPPDKIFIELNVNAMQCLTFFIGRKKYKTPLI